MSFKVKATVVAYLGDEKKYPCHFQHKPGDEFIYDGEKFIGRICPAISTLLIQQMIAVYAAGPRHIARPGFYYPFWYSPLSVDDPELKKYDGLGFRNVLDAKTEPDDPIARLVPTHAFQWPPHTTRDVAKAPAVICPDVRTSVLMKIEAVDLADKGDSTPYFRREMMILYKLMAKPGTPTGEIIELFAEKERLGIYPALSPIMVDALREELELMNFVEVRDGRASVTAKGTARFETFRNTLPEADRAALGVQ